MVHGQVVYTCVLACLGGAVNGEPVRRGRGGPVRSLGKLFTPVYLLVQAVEQ